MMITMVLMIDSEWYLYLGLRDNFEAWRCYLKHTTMDLFICFRHFIIMALLAIILSLPFEPVNSRGTKACLK
jgi:hypothetical protein